MHDGPARCTVQYMLSVLAPTLGCPRFHTFHTKRMNSECVQTLTPAPHVVKRVSHVLGWTALVLQGELSFAMLPKLQNHSDHPKPILPPLPQDNEEVAPAFDLLKSMAAVGRARSLPPPLADAAHKAVVLCTTLEKFIWGVYNTELPPTVALGRCEMRTCMCMRMGAMCEKVEDL